MFSSNYIEISKLNSVPDRCILLQGIPHISGRPSIQIICRVVVLVLVVAVAIVFFFFFSFLFFLIKGFDKFCSLKKLCLVSSVS